MNSKISINCLKNSTNNNSSLKSNDIKVSDKTISDKESKEEIESKTEDMNKSENDLNIDINYLLNNIKRFGESKYFDLIEIDFSEIDFQNISKDFNSVTQMPQNQSFSDENELSVFDENDLKKRGEEDIKKSFTAQESNDILNSLRNMTSFKSLSFEQISCSIKSFSHTLRQITVESNDHSFYRNIFEKFGYPGIAANIQMSLFSKCQKNYIIGCLYGIFENDKQALDQMFSVLFPETLVRIIMTANQLNYEKALHVIIPKPNNCLD
jgi:hypothetical protein